MAKEIKLPSTANLALSSMESGDPANQIPIIKT